MDTLVGPPMSTSYVIVGDSGDRGPRRHTVSKVLALSLTGL